MSAGSALLNRPRRRAAAQPRSRWTAEKRERKIGSIRSRASTRIPSIMAWSTLLKRASCARAQSRLTLLAQAWCD